MSAFKKLPEEIRRQIVIRLLTGILCLIFFLTAWIATGKFSISVALLLLSCLILVNGGYMLYNCLKGRYLCVAGICIDIERTQLLGRAKRIIVEVEDNIISIPMHRSLSRLHIGDTVSIYLSAQTPLIPYRDGYAINSFYAVKAERKKKDE